MKQIFGPNPRPDRPPVRPATVACLDYMKYGHSVALDNHQYGTCDKFRVRSAVVLKQRAPSYPAQVPDVSVELSDETMKRRQIHKNSYDTDGDIFKR